MKIKQQLTWCYLCDLDTPVEQPLWTELVLAVPDVLQQGAVSVELGDDLKTISRTDTQDPHNVGVVQAAQGHHVLQRRRRSVNTKILNLHYGTKSQFQLHHNQ